MPVKVETRHNGDTRTSRKYRTKKSLSVNVSACGGLQTRRRTGVRRRARRKEIGRREERGVRSLCANTLTHDRHVDSRSYVDDTVRKTFRGKGKEERQDGNSLSETP